MLNLDPAWFSLILCNHLLAPTCVRILNIFGPKQTLMR